MKTREVLAAGWRNIWNIARMLEVKQHERERHLSCYTLTDESSVESKNYGFLPFEVASADDNEEESMQRKAERYERYRSQTSIWHDQQQP